jgi:hypothetical protein
METSTSETSENFYQTTWCNNPEDSHLLTVWKITEELNMKKICGQILSKNLSSK